MSDTITELLDNIFDLKKLWNPGLFLDMENVNSIVWGLTEVSGYLILLFTVLEFARQYYHAAMNEGEINPIKPLVKVALFAFFVVSPLGYTKAFSLFFVAPFEAISDMLSVSFKSGGFAAANMGNVTETVKNSVQQGNPMFGILKDMSIVTVFASLAWTLSFIGLYLISLIQQIYIAILYCLGPLVVPFFIFEPFSDVFIGWVKKILSVLSWSIIGNIVISMIFFTGLFQANLQATGLNHLINISVLSLCLCVVCWSIPKISDAIFGAGLDAGLSATGMVGGAATAATGGSAKVAAAGAGASAAKGAVKG